MKRGSGDSERHQHREKKHLEKGAHPSLGSQPHAAGNEQKRKKQRSGAMLEE